MIQTEHVKGDVTREERIDMFEQYYLRVLCEDGQDGTEFDCAVLDALKTLKEKYQNPDKERMVGIHLGCASGG